MNVQYGCGAEGPATWRNFDTSPSLRLQRLPILGHLFARFVGPRFAPTVEIGDIVAGLPVPDRSCDAIYCAHVLEHLALADFRHALRNTRRHLKPGGTFRLVVPDFATAIREYVASDAPDAAVTFLSSGTLLGTEVRPRGIMGRLRMLWGNSRHLWMWDERALAHELAQAGFVAIRRAAFGDATLPAFRDVEMADRWDPQCCVGMECRAPSESISQ